MSYLAERSNVNLDQVNSFSVMSESYLGQASTKQKIKCISHRHNAIPPMRLEPENYFIFFVFVCLLLYVLIQQLWSWRDGQFT